MAGGAAGVRGFLRAADCFEMGSAGAVLTSVGLGFSAGVGIAGFGLRSVGATAFFAEAGAGATIFAATRGTAVSDLAFVGAGFGATAATGAGLTFARGFFTADGFETGAGDFTSRLVTMNGLASNPAR